MIKYCGVGSRSCPPYVADMMSDFAKAAAAKGWLLRSGGADGADKAFEQGCNEANGLKEIYLPWRGFNRSNSVLFPPTAVAVSLMKTVHPKPEYLSAAATQLHARNCHQVLGANLDDPVDFVICWTDQGLKIGGTRTAIVLAEHNNIPVFNLGTADSQQMAQSMLAQALLFTEEK